MGRRGKDNEGRD
jgi:hypothetical protein